MSWTRKNTRLESTGTGRHTGLRPGSVDAFLCGGACSTAMSTARPFTADAEALDHARRTSRTGAATPIVLYPGNRPIVKVANPIMSSDNTSIDLRLSLSPKCRITRPGSGDEATAKAQRGQLPGDRIERREELFVEDENGCGAEEEIVIPFDGCADEARKATLPGLVDAGVVRRAVDPTGSSGSTECGSDIIVGPSTGCCSKWPRTWRLTR